MIQAVQAIIWYQEMTLNKIKLKKRVRTCTGAIYSSVPTKEFDARIGSAKNIGAF